MKRILVIFFIFLFFKFLEYSECRQEETLFYGDIKLLFSDNNKLVFEYYPQIKKEYIETENRKYLFYNISNCSYSDEVGEPMMPERCIYIGLPLSASVEINVVETEFYEEKEEKILPVPSINTADDITKEDYFINEEIYGADGWINEGIYDYEKSEFLRKQRVQKISIYPVNYYPIKNLLRIYKRIKIEVGFLNNGIFYGNFYPDDLFENVYKNLLLNYEQCKNWRMETKEKIIKGPGQDEGIWYKINIKEEGIYVLDKQYLSSKNIDLTGIDPRTVKIYNNGGRELPQNINLPRPEGLAENNIYVYGEEDGRFDDNDFILFYGVPAFGWDYSGSEPKHYIHHYQDENVYWLTFGGTQKGKRMIERKSVKDVSFFKPENFRWRVFVENEINNIFESGLEWYGMEFRNEYKREVKIKLPGYIKNNPIKYKIALKGASSGKHNFSISEGNVKIVDWSFSSFGESSMSKEMNINLTDNESNLIFEYNNSVSIGRAFIDWIEIDYAKEFKAVDDVLFFESSGVNSEYSVSGFSGNDFWVFDVTSFAGVERITDFTIQGDKISFSDSVSSEKRKIYAVVEKSKFKSPVSIARDENSDLRTRKREADFIIITYDDFYDEALVLKEWRESNNALITEVVKVSDIYDEFSCGLMDAVAIRDFLRFAYLNWIDDGGNPPGYVLLVGDGSYDFKNIINKESKNLIPPFEIDGDSEIYSRCTDDWYVYIEGDDKLMDMAIGRLPAGSKSEAISMIHKLVNYEKEPEFGFWRNTITFVADDELTPGDNSQRIHTDQSEAIANAEYIPKILNKKKIYLMDYPGEKSITSVGIVKPKAEKDFVEQINQGSSIISYIGHGSYKILAQERVLSLSDDLPLIENDKRLFFFYPATCAFGRYDLPVIKTFAEELLIKENGGAVGILSSTREAFASQNFNLAESFYVNLFKEIPTQSLGNAVVTAKGVLAGNLINNEKFHLFCDPTLRLSLPKFRTSALKISPDTMKALATITISGNILRDSEKWSDFEGKMSLMSFDSEQDKIHVMENGVQVPYELLGVPIFRGTSSIRKDSNGEFNLGFIVPKDITYGGKNGRISVYFFNESIDGAGYLENVVVGGTADVENDFKGPEIEIGFEGVDFVSGDFLPENPVSIATISDENGINITGEIGHKIELIIDEDVKNRIDLTKFFVYKDGSFTEGEIKYRLSGISKEKHRIKIKAWDNFNNSSEGFAGFTIYSQEEFTIDKLFNYPNPFSEATQFTFEINQPINSVSDVTIKIYTVSGRLIKKIENIRVEKPGMYVSEYWNGRDEDGDRIANGLYFFKIIARSLVDDEVRTAESIGKLVISR